MVELSSVVQCYAQERAGSAGVSLKENLYLPFPTLPYSHILALMPHSCKAFWHNFWLLISNKSGKPNDAKQKTPSYSLTASLLSSLADQSSAELRDRSEDWLRREERGAAQCTQAAQHSVFQHRHARSDTYYCNWSLDVHQESKLISEFGLRSSIDTSNTRSHVHCQCSLLDL